jgi:hypothetical protein
LPTKEQMAEMAQNLSISAAEIGLVWMGGLNLDGYQHNFLPAELRNALGLKTTDASAGRQALRNLNPAVREQLYHAVVSQGGAAPFAADLGPVLRVLETAWQEKLPKRLQLDAALQKRLTALGKTARWQQVNHEELLAIATDPAGHPALQPQEIEIKSEKRPNYNHMDLKLAARDQGRQILTGATLRSFVHLAALVHAETPAGHPARGGLPALIWQTTKVLDHAGTLLELRNLYVHFDGSKQPLKVSEWLDKHIGKTKADPKDGMARLDDGFVVAAGLDAQSQALIAFRPAKLKDETDLARLHAILGIGAGMEFGGPGSLLPVVALIKGPGFQKLAKAIVTKQVPPGQWPQNPLHTAAEVVKEIQKKRKLSEDAAVLYAQLLAVPDPTAANVGAWNGWPAAQVKKAAAELVGRKLVLEATRARAGRSIFLPGEWVELKAPWLPIEAWKLGHLVEFDLNPREPCPAGGPLVLRPFEELFAAAWQRVLSGDEPVYEEVKRKKKSK